jgi:hypothetical protein
MEWEERKRPGRTILSPLITDENEMPMPRTVLEAKVRTSRSSSGMLVE